MNPYYQDDAVTIYHGDCREIATALAFDLLVSDPPYGLSNDHGTSKGPVGSRKVGGFFANDSRAEGNEAAQFCVDLGRAVCTSFYLWLSHRQIANVIPSIESNGWETRFLVWSKSCPPPPPPGAGWPSGAALCLYAYTKGRVWSPSASENPRSNVIEADAYRHGNSEKNGHPTQMPIACVWEPIRCSSYPGQIILDPYMGSGTTLRAAKELGRKAIGIELEEKYCEIAAKRMAQEVLPIFSEETHQMTINDFSS